MEREKKRPGKRTRKKDPEKRPGKKTRKKRPGFDPPAPILNP